MSPFRIATFLVLLAGANAAESKAGAHMTANPIRKIVTMLQLMVKKVEAEGEKEQKIFDDFMCYCNNGATALESSISAGKDKIPKVESDLEKTTAEKSQLESDVTKHKSDREAAKKAIATATEVREKEAKAFADKSGDYKANIAAMKKAVAAIEKGSGGAFLQTQSAVVLRQITENAESISDTDRDVLVSFLSQGSSDDDQEMSEMKSGEIVGILKQQIDTMTGDLDEITKTENKAIEDFNGMVAAQTKAIEALTANIEDKITRGGESGVEIANIKEDIEDTKKALADDTKYLADLQKNCAAQKEGYAVVVKMRQEELLAIADTIKMLNSDEALELFKKTLASASFIQEQVTSRQMRNQALALLQDTRRKHPHSNSRTSLEFITLVLAGKTPNFDKVIHMIDDLSAALVKEQEDDDAKKEYCEKQLDTIEDEMKVLKQEVEDLDALIGETSDKITTVTAEIKALQDGIKQLDKDVAEATETRKEENEDFQALMTSDTAAKELIGFAKNRMQKFYNPKMYKAPPKRELTEQERITLNMGGTLAPTAPPGGIAGTGIGFVQVRMHSQEEAADEVPPPPPPAAVPAYTKKSEESGGVLAMMDAMIGDLDKEMGEAEVDEKNAQEEYEAFMKDSAEKRAADSKAITDKEAAKAEMESSLSKAQSDKQSKSGEEMATAESLAGVHGECDWLMENFESRKEARAGEAENLKKAKSVLSGADYSLLQQTAKHRLRVKRN
eukprot:gnl/TRDRNA2_/TRDRNA2_177886_c3_seq5.p1 gnl/TRDRNA2_/TRDRNA2_177886_c3~~gnl/TRDRNA2_/TRDRNA2_177886_c3_seq5.p1  ORF type:complete len:732 (+),score=275.07 gnl/TRDRNA2_/TRDRNA2_177886_c3_seq5:93-2288(+)